MALVARISLCTFLALLLPIIGLRAESGEAEARARFSSPVQSFDELLGEMDRTSLGHGRGQVTFALSGVGFFMNVENPDGSPRKLAMWVGSSQASDSLVGRRVDVVGRVLGPGEHMTFSNAIFEVLPSAPPLVPLGIHGKDLHSAHLDSGFVTLEGTVLQVQFWPKEDVLLLSVDSEFVCVRLLRRNATGFQAPRPGSRVRVQGVFASKTLPTLGIVPIAFPFQILMRSAEDLSILRLASWWTVERMSIALISVACAAVCAFAWVVMLRRKVRAQVQRETLLEERTRVAREFHDVLEQHFTGIGLQLGAIVRNLPDSMKDARDTAQQAHRLLRKTQDEARQTIWELRSATVPHRSLADALRSTLPPLLGNASTQLIIETRGQEVAVPAAQQHHLLRIAQEAVTNVIKHAGAQTIRVELEFTHDRLLLRISDDGCGLALDWCKADGHHFGLEGMQERAGKLRGFLEILSPDSGGTTVFITAPIQPPPSHLQLQAPA